MQNETPNVAALREAYARWSETQGGSGDHWMTILADDVSAGSLAAGTPDALPLSTACNRKTELAEYFGSISRDWEMVDFRVDEFVSQGDVVVMRGAMAWRHHRTGKVFSSPKVDFWRFRNGKAVEFFECFDTAGALAATQ